MYNARDARSETLLRRAFRLIDSYINISGHHCYSEDMMKKSNPVNIPSSRFLRQYKKRFSFLEGLRLARIKNSMTFAAKNKLTYHLWWHPHNFGTNLENNLSFLEKILQHYKKLEIKFEFKSTNMQELARQFLQS